MTSSQLKSNYDVLIIGGGPAGLAAAMALGRMRRSTLICDDRRPRNLASSHMNNFPSQDGIHPAEWRAKVTKELEKYPTVSFFTGRVLKVEKSGSAFNVTLPDQPILSVRKVILAYGVEDPLPDAPGFRELWGSAVYHCPYCHGYEVRDAKLAYVGNAMMAHHVLPMLMSLTKDLVLFTNGASEIEPAFREQLKKKNIPLFQDRIASLEHEGKSLRAVKLTSGEIVERTGLFVAPKIPLTLKGSIGEKLGCEKTEMGFYKVELMGKSTVPGVFVAGDIMSMQHSVLGAAASGQLAGSGAVFELTREDFENS